jgi:hypothetical protein
VAPGIVGRPALVDVVSARDEEVMVVGATVEMAPSLPASRPVEVVAPFEAVQAVVARTIATKQTTVLEPSGPRNHEPAVLPRIRFGA